MKNADPDCDLPDPRCIPSLVLEDLWCGEIGPPLFHLQWCSKEYPGALPADTPARLAGLLRDIFGNPFRPAPTVDPAWLTSDVRTLAAGIYDEYAFDRLPILADALQDAGCDNAAVLEPVMHFRARASAAVR